MKSADDILKALENKTFQFLDLRFTDTMGRERHISIPAQSVDNEIFECGKMFDGSSIAGWQGINESDLCIKPDPLSAYVDPFSQDPTIIVRCDVVEPTTLMGYTRDPRSVAKRAEAYLQASGIADTCYFGPEPEFFMFDDVRWKVDMQQAFYQVDSREAAWNSDKIYQEGNGGHRAQVKGGYFPVPPVDGCQDIRSAMSLILEEIGINVEAHHHEVATSNQSEIATRFSTLTRKADELMMLKYVVHNVAFNYGKTATFMPKPLVGDNGNGMHVHQSLSKDGENIFAGDQYAGLSETALYYIGGIIKHARALNVFTNPTTNSYKRLVPGFEAPVSLAYSARNRSAAIRIPMVNKPVARRIEVRFPDPTANAYLAFSALLMAGIDGIVNKIHPGDPMEKDLYDLPPEELQNVPTVASSLEQAIVHLNEDREFLLAGDVFSHDLIDAYIELKRAEILRVAMTTHPVEFELYFSE